MVILELQTY